MSNNPADPFEFLRKLWAPLGLPMGAPGAMPPTFPFSGVPGMMIPTLDVAEIDKRIQDLKSVETWLSLNLEMLRTSIQGLEAQKSTIAAFQSMQANAANAAANIAASAASAAAAAAPAASAAPAPKRARRKRPAEGSQ
jgi:hypothetical protein